MKEKTKIRHKLKNNEYCSETLNKEFWGDDDILLSCMKCGFFRIINMKTFLEYQYCDEVIEETKGGDFRYKR